MAFWLDSGGQLLQPGSRDVASRGKSLVPMGWKGGGKALCAPLEHMATTKQGPRDEGGLFPTGKTGSGHDLAALYK